PRAVGTELHRATLAHRPHASCGWIVTHRLAAPQTARAAEEKYIAAFAGESLHDMGAPGGEPPAFAPIHPRVMGGFDLPGLFCGLRLPPSPFCAPASPTLAEGTLTRSIEIVNSKSPRILLHFTR